MPSNKENPWSETEAEKAEAMFRQGYSYTKIGLALGRTRCSVAGLLHRRRQKRKARAAA